MLILGSVLIIVNCMVVCSNFFADHQNISDRKKSYEEKKKEREKRKLANMAVTHLKSDAHKKEYLNNAFSNS